MIGARLKRRLFLDRIQMPGVPWRRLLVSFFLPGTGFYLRAGRTLGLAACLSCLGLCAVFVVFLGYPAANMAAGLLISIHVSSIVYLLDPWLQAERFRTRIIVSLTIMAALTCLLYLPLRHFIEEHWVMPLRVNDKVIVVQRHPALKHLRHGDWIAYSFPDDNMSRVYLHGGLDIARVVGLPGDKIVFERAGFTLNGSPQPGLPFMPQSGKWTVPEKQWFVWPGVAIAQNRGVAQEIVSDMLFKIGKVSDEQLIGKPFGSWFWRRQLQSSYEPIR